MAQIHPTALVDPAARLHDTVRVGPYCVIGPEVSVGADTVFGPHCVVQGRTTIGVANHFHAYGAIGGQPQDMSHGGEITELRIGDRNTVREFCTFNTGTHKEQGVTQVGNDNWIMAYVHLAHDVLLGNHCVLANNATLAGHVHVGDWAVIGGLTGVHQFVHIGAHSMIGFQAHVAQDVPPYMTVDGNPLSVRAVNLTGLKRREFSDARITAIRQMHRLIYRSGLTLDEAKSRLDALIAEHPEAVTDITAMLDFLAAARRGIVR